MPVQLELMDATKDAAVLRSTYARVARPHGWRNTSWTEKKWKEWLERPSAQRWIIRVGDEVGGMAELEAQAEHNVEIVVFGLVPEFTGRDFGSSALTLVTQLAWDRPHGDGVPTQRVWLHTSSRDHPNALVNYQRRGFRIFHVEHGTKEVPSLLPTDQAATVSALDVSR